MKGLLDLLSTPGPKGEIKRILSYKNSVNIITLFLEYVALYAVFKNKKKPLISQVL